MGQAGLPPATLRQLAQAIAAEEPAAAQPARPGPLPEGPLRLLTIQLQPGDLGTVTVRMRLQEGRLEIGLETGRHDTAELLRRDGGALTELLRGAGYQTDLVAIQAGGAELSGGQQGSGQGSGQGASQAAPGRGQPGFPAEGGQAGSQAGGQSGGQGGEGRNSDRTAQRGSEGPRTGERGHEAYPDARDRRGLYL
ncbi:hypothetical protein NBEOAGPD_3903 [Methylobacterium gregans]|uniref:Flagellar hook-length control protein-like C-terminal domain-containing protein n=1 Tax=Methylobacterium gregans TaxID=374424 RepID=A0AA37HS64_9HYPH|nr:flagellar hook-length control protein FliK [Methylobacterium gregans]GJD80661.1 hypothetical protein NBEOAGPD_3903 [Methylobacterium gregans]